MVAIIAQPSLPPRPTLRGFDDDLHQADAEIARLASRLNSHADDLQGRVRLLYRMFHRASLTGKMTHFEEVDTELRSLLSQFGPKEDICLLGAHLDFRFHRLAQVRSALEMSPQLAGRVEGKVLLADLDMQEGRYQESRLALESLLAENPTWDILARLAHWEGKLGEISEADRLYAEAEDLLTAKQMLSYSWIEVQRGLLAFQRGNYEAARWHYRKADTSYPGHWYTAEHIAELLAAEERFEEALEMLGQVVERTGKPELSHALGDMFVAAGQEKMAREYFDKALTAYLDSAQRGEVCYFHHLADYHADAAEDAAAALEWAKLDLQLRTNYSTQAAMAWALYRNGNLSEASRYIRLALASGVRDAVIFSTAAEIFAAAGDIGASQECASTATQTNPHYRRFRMHH